MEISIAAALDEARKELLDLSLRNTLINFRTLKAKGVQVVDEVPQHVFRILVTDGKAMSFDAAPEGEEDEDGELFAQPEEVEAGGIAARHVDTRLQTSHTSGMLQKRLLNTFYAARTHLEEQGVNVLFLALGMLEWYDASSSEQKRRAPLVLIPANLYRTSVQARFRLSYTGEEVGSNLSLKTKLKNDRGLELPDLPTVTEEVDIDDYFDAVSQAIQYEQRWQVDREAIELGFFSFGKFLMFNDLDAEQWPEGLSPDDHPVLEHLFGSGFPEPEHRLEENAYLDKHLKPKDVHHVVDADSTQILAMLDALNGCNLVIQGPPGTGKSQTITNLVAEALGRGHRVLFVSEKMAALEVVKRRLDNIGLGDACLELHSHKTNKKDLLAELGRTHSLGKPKLQSFEAVFETLTEARDRLNAYSEAVNTPVGESGVTPYEAYGHLIRLEKNTAVELPLLGYQDLRDWSGSDFSRRYVLAERMQAIIAKMDIPHKHPFWGSERTVFLPTEKPQLIEAAKKAGAATQRLKQVSELLATHLHLPVSATAAEAGLLCRAARRALEAPHLDGVNLRPVEWAARRREIEALLSSGSRLQAIHADNDDQLIPEAWEQNVLFIRQNLAAHGQKWWRFLIGDFRRAKAQLVGLCAQPLPKENEQRLAIVEAIMEAQRLSKVIEGHSEDARFLFGKQWQGVTSDWAVLTQLTKWVDELHQDIDQGELPSGLIDFLVGGSDLERLEPMIADVEKGLKVHRPYADALAKHLKLDPAVRFEDERPFSEQGFLEQLTLCIAVIKELDRLHEMVSYNHQARALQEDELAFLLEVAERWPHGGKHLADALSFNWYNRLVARALEERSALAGFDSASHETTVGRFRRLDEETFQVNRARLALAHWSKIPRAGNFGQLSILLHEMQKKRRHLPIRQLMTRAGNVIQAIKPVFMMSPMSIATYLPPGSLTFDIVIFDEASQVKPVDAFGAILRAQQAVVVGDSKQLPPTSFFDTMFADDAPGYDEDADAEIPMRAGDVESVLALFNSKGAPERMLRWHYRSRHDSLIAVSNREFYESKLVTFPSPDNERKELGLRLHHLPGTFYDRGGSRANKGEAQKVAKAVMEHARHRPEWTLGVAAFSQAQAEAVQNQLEILRRQDPSCEAFFSGHENEPFFIKNLENVQGDERDVIYISVGYGRDTTGKLTMNFGPLNRDGGERRLNVLITRARRRCEVFTNIQADDIDLSRTNARGVVALKRYLRFADTGEMEMVEVSGRPPDSPFEEAVADALRGHGYTIHHQVGSAGYFVDLAVVDPEAPGRYLLGIECDGATYHRAQAARDRDRIRQSVLEGLGWQLHRIWSTDWFRNPERELKKVIEAIHAARARSGTPPAAAPAAPSSPPTQGVDRHELEEVESAPKRLNAPYQMATLPKQFLPSGGLTEVTFTHLAELLRSVVQVESPVHVHEAMRRVIDAYGVAKIGRQIRKHLEVAIQRASNKGWLRRHGSFLYDADRRNIMIRDRSTIYNRSRKLEFIAPVEIRAAIVLVVRHAHGIPAEEVPTATCTLLGFSRTTAEMATQVHTQIEALLQRGRIVDQHGLLMPGDEAVSGTLSLFS